MVWEKSYIGLASENAEKIAPKVRQAESSKLLHRASMAVALSRPRKARRVTAPLTMKSSSRWQILVYLIVVHHI
ncbi:hypothetical protein Y032_0569g76 [Ancylostoma ceylanicum]|uniref:Uncharacterized protein n=1 Tax=Ancylostoma ceylanicum TaxID=53326 RepID=A0A016WQ85_9BILA|nr:hypothetical protein Y032_0569g76 [Ancylostoma ceylanicum]